jgi:cysteinyl-tRNA synthetase
MNSAYPRRQPRPLRIQGQVIPAVGRVRMYVCGITPYDVTHLGHASTFIWADAADKVLSWAGHTVVVARNVTDVDDALYAAAAARGADASQLGALQRASFESTMRTLRVRTPDFQPTAATTVGHVIQLASSLLDRGRAYLSNGSVYAFSPTLNTMPEREALALSAEFGDHPDDPDKRGALDIAVWRAIASCEPGGAAWPSPWGDGRPGWHAECAAMALSLFGSSLDIHCGGADLAYPHHACESALAEAATGVAPFARAWLRAAVVQLNGEKMAKSTGNLVLVEDLLRTHSPAAIRLLCLNRPRDLPWSFTAEALDAAEVTARALQAAAGPDGDDVVPEAMAAALLHDLDIQQATAIALEQGGGAARALVRILALQ